MKKLTWGSVCSMARDAAGRWTANPNTFPAGVLNVDDKILFYDTKLKDFKKHVQSLRDQGCKLIKKGTTTVNKRTLYIALLGAGSNYSYLTTKATHIK